MTPDMDRRSNPDGKRGYVWPNWARIGYRALTTPWGVWIARIVVGFAVFGVIAGGIIIFVLKNIPTDEVEIIGRKVEDIEKKAETAARKAEGAERKSEKKTETIEQRLDRIEDAITNAITTP